MKVTDARALKNLIETLKAANVSHFRSGDLELTFEPAPLYAQSEEQSAPSRRTGLPTSWDDIMPAEVVQ